MYNCTYLFEKAVLTSCEHVSGHVSVQVALLAEHVVTFPALKIEQPCHKLAMKLHESHIFGSKNSLVTIWHWSFEWHISGPSLFTVWPWTFWAFKSENNTHITKSQKAYKVISSGFLHQPRLHSSGSLGIGFIRFFSWENWSRYFKKVVSGWLNISQRKMTKTLNAVSRLFFENNFNKSA